MLTHRKCSRYLDWVFWVNDLITMIEAPVMQEYILSSLPDFFTSNHKKFNLNCIYHKQLLLKILYHTLVGMHLTNCNCAVIISQLFISPFTCKTALYRFHGCRRVVHYKSSIDFSSPSVVSDAERSYQR